ncbi:acyl-CoA dehydrogenase family protein [Saccharothrix sp. HUAS TT1]|uniref:acyl-CoA dehydrogenase family protein n=1 Tax=unclassified Saccharothrix TaxID=2593673 RepID=UPI00345BFAFD
MADGVLPTFFDSVDTGVLDWAALRAFPEPDRSADALVEEVGAHVAAVVDPGEVDRTGALPDGLVDGFRERGWLLLANDKELGGLGLSYQGAFRVIERAARWSVPVGQVLGVQNGVGAAALLRALPEGPLADFVRARLADGALSGFADTEPAGQNNSRPGLTATPTPDGRGYLLRGQKLFIGNGPVADLLGASVLVVDGDERRVGICYFDTASPGFRVRSRLEFMGSRGLPNGWLEFDDVHVPAEHVWVEGEGVGMPGSVAMVALVGRLLFTGAPALAIARSCLEWSREFVARRRVDGRELVAHDHVRRMLAATAADAFAIDSAIRWSLASDGLTDRWWERFVAKNLCVRAGWRAVDRTVSLLGGEGFETAASKARRGATPSPVERALRDARGLRVAGNIDFRLDEQVARLALGRRYDRGEPAPKPAATALDADLSALNRAHLAEAAAQLAQLHETTERLVADHPDRADLFARQHTVTALGAIAGELFGLVAVLSRVDGERDAAAQRLAEVHGDAARERLAGWWRQLAERDEPDFAAVGADVLAGTAAELLDRI